MTTQGRRGRDADASWVERERKGLEVGGEGPGRERELGLPKEQLMQQIF